MIELRWLEYWHEVSEALPRGTAFRGYRELKFAELKRKLQYRELISRDEKRTIYTDWQDVPTVKEGETEDE